jgi:hypothetical protein
MRTLISFLLCSLLILPVLADDPVDKNIQQANSQIKELQDLLKGGQDLLKVGRPQPKELQWNRYVTKNFEILSLDDAQGKYLNDNLEFMKTWILWRWGIKDADFQAPCKVVCVPSSELYEKLFNRKTSAWRADLVNGKTEGIVWIIADQQKWNVSIPNQLTEVVLANFEALYGRKMPVWCHRGMSVLNGRLTDVRASVIQATKIDTKNILETTFENYNKLNEVQKATFDAQAATFCLWARQEHNWKVFLDFLAGSMINPEHSLQYLGVNTYVLCDSKVQFYQQKLLGVSDHYLTW